ncbi:methylamine utilization protein [Dissulfurispira thermophila]|uniref:Methylamine utilization protein n=1 Tax=Dissulfurispira thermophila TaxID=2715679 RepID=A0A7G1GYP9_9BACT|nr:cytochrome c peroxidase [Dissulfurispira thermophila]BCB95585.1 methylamine utilization protein [Dissulfurispira thermophila]
MRKYLDILIWTGILCLIIALGSIAAEQPVHQWTPQEKEILKSLWIDSLPPMPSDYSNKYAEDLKAVALGRKFFFDSRFSGNMKVSCATCHPENMNFADNLPRAHGMGTTKRRTMPLIGVAYSPWLFWDGRKDSLWAQALGPIESPVEHGFSRTQVVVVIKKYYQKEYERVFGPLPEIDEDHLPLKAKPSQEEPVALKAWVNLPEKTRKAINQVYVNFGKAIGAFVRTMMPTPSRFDRYVEALLKGDIDRASRILTPEEVNGLRLFIGKARCLNCHNGPMFTDYDFHNIVVQQPSDLPIDNGRADGIVQVLTDEFNCLGPYSDAIPRQCRHLRFMSTDVVRYKGAFKTPTLRNVAERAPYMHAGQFSTLHKVLHFYRDMPRDVRTPELEHGSLTDEELSYLEAFLKTLSSPPKVYKEGL